MKIERLPSGRDFVDDDGDVRHVSDLTPDMEPVGDWADAPAAHAVRGLARVRRKASKKSRRRGKAYPEITGRDIGRDIDEALAEESERLGRPLTDEEMQDVARRAERRALGFED